MRSLGLAYKALLYSAVSALLSLFPSAMSQSAYAQTAAPQSRLELKSSIDGTLSRSSPQEHQIRLEAGQFARVSVEQQGIDLIVSTISPSGQVIAITDSPNNSSGAEIIFLLAKTAGYYSIKVETLRRNAAPGHYRIELQELRPQQGGDAQLIKAQDLCTAAISLMQQETAKTNQQAREKFREALPLFHSVQESDLEMRTLNFIGLLSLDLGDVASALEVFNQALIQSRALNNQRYEAWTLNNLAETYYLRGDFRLALDYYKQSLKVLPSLGDFQKESSTLNTVGSIYTSLGEPDAAIRAFESAAALAKANGLNRVEGHSISKLGAAYFSLGEYQKALDYFSKAITLSTNGNDASGEAVTLNNMGKVYLALEDFPKANEYFRQALEKAQKTGNRILIPSILNDLGQAMTLQSEVREALDILHRALVISREIGAKSQESRSLFNLGMAYRKLGDYQLALKYLKDALDQSEKSKNLGQTLDNLFGVGATYISAGEPSKAVDPLVRALDLSRRLNDRRIEANTLFQLSTASLQSGDLARARDQITQAIEIIEKLRTKFALQDMRAAYLGAVQSFYKLYIDVLMVSSSGADDSFAADALKANEMARARSLLDLIVESQLDPQRTVSRELIAEKTRIRREIDAKSEQLMLRRTNEENDRLTEEITESIAKLDNELREIESRIRQESPAYADMVAPKPLTLTEIQRQVIDDDDTLLLEFSLGESKSYLWAVGKNSFSAYILPSQAKIEAAARELYPLLSERPTGSQSNRAAQLKAFSRAAAILSQQLLTPVASLLQTKRLIIVCEGALQYIPFGALPLPETAEKILASKDPIRLFKPLITEHEILGAQSATTLAVQRSQLRDRKPAAHSLAILADPVFGRYDDRLQRQLVKESAGAEREGAKIAPTQRSAFEDLERSGNLKEPKRPVHSGARTQRRHQTDVVEGDKHPLGGSPAPKRPPRSTYNKWLIARLAFSRDEAMAIYSLAPKDSFLALDFDANRMTAMDPALGQYQYLHFALHGIIDSENPRETGLIFSTVDKNGKPKNGLLSLQDIYDLKLPAEMVVLSACQSGLGREIKGEGFLGLTRGFMHAGARRVTASLWKINDAATSELMKQFYIGMLGDKKLSPSSALREAQLAIWKQSKWQAPYFWAAFVLQGEW
jgi:CHAT domain-containing protein/Tfp pilus assembly protein PilF